MTTTTKTAIAKTTATKTTIAKTTATKTVKKTLSLKAQAAKRAQVKRNRKAGSKKASLMAKKKGIGLFAPVSLSAELAAICGGKKMPRTEVTKKLWAYIKAKKCAAKMWMTTRVRLVHHCKKQKQNEHKFLCRC